MKPPQINTSVILSVKKCCRGIPCGCPPSSVHPSSDDYHRIPSTFRVLRDLRRTRPNLVSHTRKPNLSLLYIFDLHSDKVTPSCSPQKSDRFNHHEIFQNHLPTLLQHRFPVNFKSPKNPVIFCGICFFAYLRCRREFRFPTSLN